MGTQAETVTAILTFMIFISKGIMNNKPLLPKYGKQFYSYTNCQHHIMPICENSLKIN